MKDEANNFILHLLSFTPYLFFSDRDGLNRIAFERRALFWIAARN